MGLIQANKQAQIQSLNSNVSNMKTMNTKNTLFIES